MLRRIAPCSATRFLATTTTAASSSCVAFRASSSSSNNGNPSLETLLSGTNAAWLDSLYEQWTETPSSVDPAFAAFFEQVKSSQPITLRATSVPTGRTAFAPAGTTTTAGAVAGGSTDDAEEEAYCKGKQWLAAFKNSTTREAQLVLGMILEFETSGHTRANLDPLKYFSEKSRVPLNKRSIEISHDHLGLSENDLNMKVPIGFCDNLGGIFRSVVPAMSVRDLHERLTKTYTGNIGWEFMHLDNHEQIRWLRDQIENSVPEPVDRNKILEDLADAVSFETFCHRKYGVTKRFGLEGGESLVPGLRALVHRSVDRHGVKKFVLGMAHRGRLNVLVNCCGKPMRAVFKEFDSITRDDLPDDGRCGDVKYHLGWRSDGLMSRDKNIEYCMQLMFNPSHLEAVNPIVQGYARALQHMTSIKDGHAAVVPITLHGDAAYSGQGIVYEDHVVSEVPKYSTGGTIHVVINNQVGYTTNPADSRSSQHASDIARGFALPIFHVNSDCPEDVVRVFNMAADFRAQFRRSVVIDLVCYRRRGHNEGDDASMTQPGMARAIAAQPNVFDVYRDQLIADEAVTEDAATQLFEEKLEYLKQEKEEAAAFDYKAFLMEPQLNWENHVPTKAEATMDTENTKISQELYDLVAKYLTEMPANFNINPRMANIYAQRKADLAKGVVDYPTAEALAIGSLLSDHYSFRISGQDVERGTFSHRHYVLHDDKNEGVTHTPLLALKQHFVDKQTEANGGSKAHASLRPYFTVTNSPLSEYAVMGYDAGYSLVSPKRIVMWEAQFGDFVNGAQCIIDQFLVSGFTKWGLQYNAIISLPHGYDGQGCEHSSARMERFLQLVAEDEATPDFATEAEQHWSNNIEIIVPSTSQSYFHLLRRHALRNFRRPTFIFFSKSRLKAQTSSMSDFTSGSFQPVIPDTIGAAATGNNDAAVKRIVLTQGQLYFDIEKHIAAKKIKDTAVIRIEQLSPFPKKALLEQINRYPATADIVWAQQEPQNMGAFCYLEPRFENALPKGRAAVRYVGRAASASPATSSANIHAAESALILQQIFQ